MKIAEQPGAGPMTPLMKIEAANLPILDPNYKSISPTIFTNLRKQAGPIVKIRLPNGVEAWLAVDNASCRRVLSDNRFSKQAFAKNEDHPIFKHLLVTDGPDHGRLRKILMRGMSAANIAALRPAITIQAEALATAIDLDADGRADLVKEYALPLALHVICRLLDIPPADDITVQAWSETLLQADMEDSSRAFSIAQEIESYLIELEKRTRAEPGSGLFHFLVEAMDNAEITEAELRASAFLMLAAGYETSSNMISSGALMLLQAQNHWRSLSFGSSFAAHAVEEVLRFHSPLEISTPRRASVALELFDTCIEAGDLVFAAIGAANRDPVCFRNSQDFAPDRSKACRHIAFGTGPHTCLGIGLARLEGEVALRTLARTWPTMQLAISADDAAWNTGLVMRGLETLPVKLETRG